MSDLHSTLSSVLADRYTSNAKRIHELAAPLTENQFWQKPFPFGNSFGHLVLHLGGNLNYYVGTQIANTGYVRDRDREFAKARHLPKEDVLKSFDEAIAMVQRTVRAQSVENWSASYTAVGAGDAGDRFHMVL